MTKGPSQVDLKSARQIQALFITAIQGMLESWTHFRFIDWGMTIVLVAALLVENIVIENKSSQSS